MLLSHGNWIHLMLIQANNSIELFYICKHCLWRTFTACAQVSSSEKIQIMVVFKSMARVDPGECASLSVETELPPAGTSGPA